MKEFRYRKQSNQILTDIMPRLSRKSILGVRSGIFKNQMIKIIEGANSILGAFEQL
jgi:hypothetical protein